MPDQRSSGRMARAGIALLAAFAIWMIAGRALLAAGGPRQSLFGWGVIQETLELGGHALAAFRLALALLWASVPAWIATAGFRYGPVWLVPARAVLGLGGLAAAVPLLIAGAVIAANAAFLALIVLAVLFLILSLLLRLLTAPFRW
jgi:hypothetical protein